MRFYIPPACHMASTQLLSIASSASITVPQLHDGSPQITQCGLECTLAAKLRLAGQLAGGVGQPSVRAALQPRQSEVHRLQWSRLNDTGHSRRRLVTCRAKLLHAQGLLLWLWLVANAPALMLPSMPGLGQA